VSDDIRDDELDEVDEVNGLDDLADELGRALREVDPLLAAVARRAKGAFTWRTIEEDLRRYELTFDSTLASAGDLRSETAPPSGGPAGRVLIFTAAPQSVEVEVLSDCLVGQFVPATAGTVVVELDPPDEPIEVTVDEGGFFVLSPVPRGVVRFRCQSEGTVIVSPWVRL
jgi:hypothetical protein